MKTVFEHIEHVKGKPHHIRRQVAFGASAVVTVVVALVWLTSNLASGSFAIRGSDFSMSNGQDLIVATSSDAVSQGLAGAGAAAILDNNSPAHIEIVDTSASSPKKQPEQTILPF